jgi:acetyl-CoA synthetase
MDAPDSLENQPIVWQPTAEVIERSRLMSFMRQVGVSTWPELYRFSVDNIEKFTEEVIRFLDLRFDPPFSKLLDMPDGPEFPVWLKGAGFNVTESCLDRWQKPEDAVLPAIIWESETGETRTLTYGDLFDIVAKLAGGLKKAGFVRGDAIGIYLPMIPETVISLLAINRIGAIAVPVFSGYGVEAIASRLNAVGAKGLFAASIFFRRGKIVDSLTTALAAAQRCTTVNKLIVISHGNELNPGSNDEQPEIIDYNTLIAEGILADAEKTGAEDPLIILYTSGTTGKPKGIAHTHASFPIKAAQDMAFGTDVGKGTRICWYTDIGWMMGPWLIYGALINGATVCLYDGAPDYPNPDRIWEFSARHSIEILGISPTLVRAMAAYGDDLPKRHDLSALRFFASTGEPWNPSPWRWLFEVVGNSRVPIINYSGGTEISGGILMGNPLLPMKPCSFPAPCPGIDADIFDENGHSVPAGTVGELVIKQPWIGMARGFWKEKERYLETYWRRFPGVWVHGDFAMRDNDGHWFILGRSDDTLKVAGKRVGPAEVESVLVSHPEVVEAAVIGIPDEIKGTTMIAFCVLRNFDTIQEGQNATLVSQLKDLVSKQMGKPLAPSQIHFVSALPKTRNAKVMRRVIRSAYLGEDPGDLSALENPAAVNEIIAAGER